MNDNVKLWLEALRSGEYEQTKRRLHNQHGYCCLGVACEVYIKAGNELAVEVRDPIDGTVTYGGDAATLPEPVRIWLGFRTRAGDYCSSSKLEYSDRCLAAENDRGMPFTEIADIIESEPKTLFVS